MFCKKRKNIFDVIMVIIVSFIMIAIISKGNWNFGLYDDNQTQWLPIIDKAYQTLFQTGELPTIDFLQMKGMKIYDQGYYGLWNPFMLCAYFIKTYLFFFVDTNTITVYIIIMILLGNICAYKIFREYEVNRYHAILMSSVLLSVSTYIAFSYWYYIYNVYFILTWLLLKIVKNHKTRSYYEFGAILSLSLLMGNIQYTVYMYLAFLLLMGIFFIQGDKKALGKLISNTVCMGILSVFYLLMLLGVSLRSVDFSGDNSGYYSNAVHPVLWAIFSWIPASFLGEGAEVFANTIYTKCVLPDVCSFPEIGSMYMGVCIVGVIFFFKNREKTQKDYLYQLTIAGVITACIILVISFGKIGILAIFVEQMPFLNSFRILSKYMNLLPPLLLPCIAYTLRENKAFFSKKFVLLFLFMLFGVIQNREISFGVPEISIEKSVESLEKGEIDYHNYRIVSFASYNEIQVIYPQWEDFAEREKISLEEKFSKNSGVLSGVITLGGYDLSFDYRQFEMSDSIMGTISGYANEFGYDNMVIEEYFFGRYDRNHLDYQEDIDNLKHQIESNNVKYFIFSKESPYLSVFLQMLSDMQIKVEWQKPFMEHTEIISIKDATPIVINNKHEKIEAVVTMNKISFASQDEESFQIGMYYDENLKAFHENKNGKRTTLSIMSNEEGYILLPEIENLGEGIIEIRYCNKWYEAGKIWTVVVLIIIIILLFAPELEWIEKGICLLEKKMKKGMQLLLRIQPQKGVWICFMVMLCCYSCFLGIYYLHIQCTVPDEDWFVQMFQTIHNMAGSDIVAYFAETENYLGYGQIYWILGSIFSNIFFLRIAALGMLLGSMFLVLREVRMRFGMQMVPYAGILWMSIPFAWYSDKIIGPEIFGLFLGLLGLAILNSKKSSYYGWCLLGLACAVKMNYAIFSVAAMMIYFQKNKKKINVMVEVVSFGGIGFLMGNPILLWNFATFLENVSLEGNILLNQLSYVFTIRMYEWDGVMVNGVFRGYSSAFLLFILIMGFIIKKYSRKDNYIMRQKINYGNGMVVISLLLILVCCRDMFLGWYLLPLCYFLVMAVCSLFYFKETNRKFRNLHQWALIICLLINMLFLLPEHVSNRSSNMKYMRMLHNREEIIETVKSEKETIETLYEEAKWHYLLEYHMGEYSYNFGDYSEFCMNNAEGIAVIGERMRIVEPVDSVVRKAINEEDGLCVLKQSDDFWIIKRGYE